MTAPARALSMKQDSLYRDKYVLRIPAFITRIDKSKSISNHANQVFDGIDGKSRYFAPNHEHPLPAMQSSLLLVEADEYAYRIP